MNKRKIDQLIPDAYAMLAEVNIAEDGKIEKAWRGQISAFGAAISTGSLLAAIAFFSEQGSAKVEREHLMTAIAKLIGQDDLFKYVKSEDERKAKEEIINAAIALKLAMNLYVLVRGES
jgi:CRISPR-associated protein Cmr5